MKDEIQELVDQYMTWLRDKTALRDVDGNWVEITTPNLDRHNDYIQLYVGGTAGNYILTDGGYTIIDLENSGCNLDSPKRKELLQTTLAGFGVQIYKNELQVKANVQDFSLKKHSLVQAMLSVNDLFYLASPYVASVFYEDVAEWMDSIDVRFTPRIKFTGKSGYDHMFDFVIPKSRRKPERIVQAINNPNKDSAESMVFKWLDTRETRASDSMLYAILNDQTGSISPSVIEALTNYEALAVPWSKRHDIQDSLTA